MKNNISIREWIEKFNNGEFDSKDFDTQVNAGWYDWFCKEQSLSNRLKKMGNIIKDIKNDYILDNYYVWFKNNCPLVYHAMTKEVKINTKYLLQEMDIKLNL